MATRRFESAGEQRAYKSWSEMKQRCLNKDHHAYPNYGGRGVKICWEWLHFESFFADMGPRPERLTLERIDNDGDYTPSNCRWATRIDQANNRRVPDRAHLRGVKHPWDPEKKQEYSERRQQMKLEREGVSSDEARAKVSAKMLGREVSEETRARIRDAQEYRPLADDHVKALRASYEGERGEARRKHMSKLMKGRTFSEETRRRMSEAAKRRWKE